MKKIEVNFPGVQSVERDGETNTIVVTGFVIDRRSGKETGERIEVTFLQVWSLFCLLQKWAEAENKRLKSAYRHYQNQRDNFALAWQEMNQDREEPE